MSPPPRAVEPTAPVDAPRPPENLASASDLVFVIRDYHWEIGASEITTVRGDLSVEHIFFRGTAEPIPRAQRQPGLGAEWMVTRFYRARFTLTPEVFAGLVQRLEEGRFRALDARYVNEQVEDGAHTRYTLTAHGATHEVSCSNLFPEPVQRTHDYVREQILAPHAAELAAAPEITREEAVADGGARGD